MSIVRVVSRARLKSAPPAPSEPAEPDAPAVAVRRPPRSDGKADARNSEFAWDHFDPHAYKAHNYDTMRADDQLIVRGVRDHFARARLAPHARGLDVGPGANLYPTLAMLPFCGSVDLVEYSPSNVAWLLAHQRRLSRFDRSWHPFWNLYGESAAYGEYVRGHNPLADFRRKATVSQGSIFKLRRRTWDIGTMFFVACSLSDNADHFRHAVNCFLQALKHGAPFAAAFMTGSDGYEVNGRRFPAVPVTLAMIQEALDELAPKATLAEIPTDLRPGVGMVLATGYRRPATRPPAKSQARTLTGTMSRARTQPEAARSQAAALEPATVSG